MACYRIRMKYGKDGHDFSKEVWQAGLVGFWFGSWDIQDLYDAYAAYPPKQSGEVTNFEIEAYVNNQLKLRQLPANMKAEYVPTIKAFDEALVKDSWVCTYFDGQLHLGQISDETTRDESRFNWKEEHFKARTVTNCKSFEVASLPDAFRLIASAGRQTIHKLTAHSKLASLLIECEDVNSVLSKIRTLPFNDWIDILGDKGWESICTAYLILAHGFLPTGLLIGGTLPDFDIVGRDLNGTAIYGQCKKNPELYRVTESDLKCFECLPFNAKKFFFPYQGLVGNIPNVAVISFKQLEEWMDGDEVGRKYKNILRLGGSVSSS